MKVVITVEDVGEDAVIVLIEPPPAQWETELTPAGHVASVAFAAISEYLKLMCSNVNNPYENLQ